MRTARFLDRRRLAAAFLHAADHAADPAGHYTLRDDGGGAVPVRALAWRADGTAELELGEAVDPARAWSLAGPDGRSVAVDPVALLDDPSFFYAGDDLGATWSPAATRFRVWTPVASAVRVLLYPDAASSAYTAHPLARDAGGTWAGTIDGNIAGSYYLYEAVVRGRAARAPDPCSACLSANGGRTLVFDPRATDPPGWDEVPPPPPAPPVDAVLYEAHVRDLTMHPNSGVRRRGKYLGLAEEGTRGPGGLPSALDHLAWLGVTHVHLLPVYDFSSVDERDDGQYNWGYDPAFYNSPEGQYATDPDGDARVREFKALVLAFHRRGLGVVLDAVYNHVHSVGASAFEALVPGYWFRRDAAGRLTNGSGCGNDVATERPMVRKFILDSLRHWVREYRVDGFRFDLWGLFDEETVRAVARELPALRPGLLLYGEPWRAGDTGLPEERLFGKGKHFGLPVAIFNDEYRNALKGDNDGAGRGFVQGQAGQVDAVREGLAGSVNGYVREPGEGVNYASCHDNLTLWDKLAKSCPHEPEDLRLRRGMLAAGLVLLAQGVPFLHGGEELARSKHGIHNSFDKGDAVNRFDWSRRLKYRALGDWYRGLVALRRAHRHFRLPTAAEIRARLSFPADAPAGCVAAAIDGTGLGDAWTAVVVACNPGPEPAVISLPGAGWRLAVDGERVHADADAPPAGPALVLPPVSLVVAFRD